VQRYVALDAHKHYVVIGAVSAQQDIVLKPVRVTMAELPDWIKSHLHKTDAVVIESTSNAWHLHDLIQPLGAKVVIANPSLIKLIAHARVKTDARDTIHLARLLAAGLVPAVWVPPPAIRDLRGLVAHRTRLIAARTQAKNRLHAVLQRHAIAAPPGDTFAGANRAWWDALALSPTEKLRIRHDCATLDHLRPLIAQADTELERLSAHALHRDAVTRLIQLPGIGLITAMTVLAAVGDITRFDSAKQLSGYAGLGAAVHSSGQTHHTGRITKQGRCDLRAALIEAAWDEPFVARKILAWAERLNADQRAEPSTGAFIRRRLQLLGLGASIKAVPRGPNRSVPLPDPTTT
jgi:transposase